MSGRWFRFYADAMRNPKVARLTDKEFRLWVELLAVAAENDGAIPCTDDLKHLLKRRLDHLSTGVERLLSIGLIDALSVGYEPHHWSKFQYKSDTSTERVHKYRAKRNVSETAPDTEADTDTEANASGDKPPSNVTAVDFTKSIFDTGTTILTASGKTDREARSILGRWRKTYSDSAVLTCLARCQVIRPEEPLEWVTKALQAEQRSAIGATNGSSVPTRESTRQTGERLAARLAG